MASFMDSVSNFFSGNDTDTGEGLKSLFISELKDIYYAEGQAIDALGDQADAATTDEVRNAFLHHQEESRNQRTRLERVFDSLGISAEQGTCNAIDGLADDGERVVSNTESGSLTRDAGLIIAAQKVEHHEIASYGSVVTLAQVLGYNEAAQLLQQTLEEEKNADKKLTQLAESFINNRAAGEQDTDAEHDRFRDTDRVTNEAVAGSAMLSGSGTMGGAPYTGEGYGTDPASTPGNSGSGFGKGATAGGVDYDSNTPAEDNAPTPRYSPSRDATLGGSSGI